MLVLHHDWSLSIRKEHKTHEPNSISICHYGFPTFLRLHRSRTEFCFHDPCTICVSSQIHKTKSQKISPQFPSLCRPDITHHFRIVGSLVFSIISPPNNFLHGTEPHFAIESESYQTRLMIKLLLCHYYWSLFH